MEVAAGSQVVAMSGLARNDGGTAGRDRATWNGGRYPVTGSIRMSLESGTGLTCGRTRIARDEPDQQAVEEGGRAVVDRDHAVRVQGPTTRDRAELGQEGSTRRHEEGDRFVGGDPGDGEAIGQLVGRGDGIGLRAGPPGIVRCVEMVQKGADEPAAAVAERIVLGRGDGGPDVASLRPGRVAAAVRTGQPVCGGTERGETDRRVVASRL